MTDTYILGPDNTPIRATHHEWARWFENDDNRAVALTPLPDGGRVSTVFLGLNHEFRPDHPPVLWETMVFDTPDGDDRQTRYTSHEDALAGHAAIVAELQAD